MKRICKAIAVLMLSLALCALASSCGKNRKEAKAPYVGSWAVTAESVDELTESLMSLDEYRSDANARIFIDAIVSEMKRVAETGEMVIVLNEDGTFTAGVNDNEAAEYRVDEDGTFVSIVDGEEYELGCFVDNFSALEMTDSDSGITVYLYKVN